MSNKIWAVPLPSSPEVLKNKNISIRTYALLMLYSNWGGTMCNNDTRFLYDNKLSDNVNEILTTLNISRNTLRKHLFNLRTLSKGIFKTKMVKDELVYMLSPKDKDGKNFILIRSDILLKLICNCNENCIRIFIILCYACRGGSRQLTHQWLSESIGNSSNSRRLISKAVNDLELFNFISVERTKTVHKVLNESTGKIICNPKDVHCYSITSKN
ncbi:hypothetical protein [Clostridium butyricum]|uniref:hypothetical protein n=1 Tax=Clostridium butyricum TaxID=1492 RepID=UPI0021029F8F|nr:hypothetical protein [Clostridium butyricum]MCQ2011972.1 hypothetical protein [Clostridium butyricum]MCQ2027804.1 hypothetical protein [Clostridium butyricum]